MIYTKKSDSIPSKIQFKCNEKDCQFVSEDKNELSEHMKTDHKQSAKALLVCSECQFKTTSENELISHKNIEHLSGMSANSFKIDVKTEPPELITASILDPLELTDQAIPLRRRNKRFKMSADISDRVNKLTNDEMQYNFYFTQDITQPISDIKVKPMSALKMLRPVNQLLGSPQIEIKCQKLLEFYKRCLKTKPIIE